MAQRTFWLSLLGLSWLLAACASQPPTAMPAASPTPSPRPSPSPTPPRMTCRLVAQPRPTPDPSTYLLPQDHLRGAPDASVVLLMYGDFQCPGCAALAQSLQRLQATFGPQAVAVVYRHFPLAEDNDKALLAVQAAEAAARQAAFWPFHDALYARQAEWRDLTPDAFRAWLLDTAAALGLDPQAFAADLDDPALAAQAQAAWQVGLKAGLRAVPALFVNGQPYTGPPTYDALRTVVALELLAARQFHRCPPWVLRPQRVYRLTFETNRGPVALLLDPSLAPQAVNSLVFLAREGWFDAMPVYRVEPGRAVYWGDPSGTGYGHAGYFFDLELSPAMRYDAAGWVGLVNEGPGTNSSRFFITLAPWPALNGRATRVGRVVQGLAVLQSLPAWPADGSPTAGPPLQVLHARVDESE